MKRSILKKKSWLKKTLKTKILEEPHFCRQKSLIKIFTDDILLTHCR